LKNFKIRTVILPVVLCGCATWSITVREEHGLKIFEDRMFMRLFGPKREDITGGLRKLHNDELHNFKSLPNIIQVIKSRRMK
jgi:hypothetical protein